MAMLRSVTFTHLSDLENSVPNAPATELTGDEDRPASSQLLAVDFGNLPGHFDLAARRFGSLCAFAVVGCRKCHQKQRHRLAVTPPIALGVGGEDSAEVQAVVPAQRVGCRARLLLLSDARRCPVG